MSTSSTKSIPLISMRQSHQGVVIFNVELKMGQSLPQTFFCSDIIGGLVFGHTIVEPVLIQKLDTKATLLVFPHMCQEDLHYTVTGISMVGP